MADAAVAIIEKARINDVKVYLIANCKIPLGFVVPSNVSFSASEFTNKVKKNKAQRNAKIEKNFNDQSISTEINMPDINMKIMPGITYLQVK